MLRGIFNATTLGPPSPPASDYYVFSISLSVITAAVTPFTVTVKKADGSTDTGYTGTITFSSSDVAAGLPSNYAFLAGDHGVKSFNVIFNTTGTRSISGVDTIDAAITGSQGGISVADAFKSMSFDGVSGYATINPHVGVNPERTDPFTVSFWVKVIAFNPGAFVPIWVGVDFGVVWPGMVVGFGGASELLMNIGTDLATGTNYSYQTNVGPFADNVWIHCVAAYDGANTATSATFYRNGSSLTYSGSGVLPTSSIVSTVPVTIAAAPPAGFYSNVKVTQLTYWNIALNAAQVTELYNGGVNWDINKHSKVANSVSYYAVAGVTAPTVNDVALAGHNNTATLTGGATIVVDAP